jgi:REP element-mobilizing transposase RayT
MNIAHPVRKHPRLSGYDYSQSGAYFLTLCSHNKENTFGLIRNGHPYLSPLGVLIHEQWLASKELRPGLTPDHFVIMPNQMHGIVWLQALPSESGRTRRPELRTSLSSFVKGFKASVTSRYNRTQNGTLPVWQRNYYEHIIRSQEDLDRAREYIRTNPENWGKDKYHPVFSR